MPIRFVVEREAMVTRQSWDGWSLCLQWGWLTDEAGRIDQRGYRNIWRDPTGRLFTGRAQARIPSKAISDELWAIAGREGWADLTDDEIRKDPEFGPVTLVWHSARPLGFVDRGGEVAHAQTREFPTNEAAIRYICERMDQSDSDANSTDSHDPFVDPFIMAVGEINWTRTELQLEYGRRRRAMQ